MDDSVISTLTLERYHAGEVTGEEREVLETVLIGAPGLAASLADLDRLDREFLKQYPAAEMVPRILLRAKARGTGSRREIPPRRRSLAWGLCAAALALAILVPVLGFRSGHAGAPGRPGEPPLTDRAKGQGLGGWEPAAELRVYLKTDTRDLRVGDRTVLRAGNTIQLTYLVNPPPGPRGDNPAMALIPRDRYGVIFSIDSRSTVTLHFPYTLDQGTRLVTGRPVPLDEAYTLDDAPRFELFFFVIDDEPLDTRAVIRTAQGLAQNLGTLGEQGESAFWNYQLITLLLHKE